MVAIDALVIHDHKSQFQQYLVKRELNKVHILNYKSITVVLFYDQISRIIRKTNSSGTAINLESMRKSKPAQMKEEDWYPTN